MKVAGFKADEDALLAGSPDEGTIHPSWLKLVLRNQKAAAEGLLSKIIMTIRP